MKKIYVLVMAATLLAGVQKVMAQDGFSQLIKANSADASALMSAYAEPLFRGLGTDLNSGWNTTAKTKSLLHFELRFSASAAFIPIGDQSFDVRNIGLSGHITPDASTPTYIAPTVGGNTNAVLPVMDIINDNGTKIGTFTMPKAITNVIPAPSIQLTIGLISSTDLTIRTIPTISMGDVGSVGMIGFGLKHNFMGGGDAKLVPFDLAVAVNYNRINYSKPLNVQPNGTQPAPGNPAGDFSNQHIDASFTGINAQLIVSKKLMFFTPFLSVGYQSASTDLTTAGNYPVTSTVPSYSQYYAIVTNPVNISETTFDGMRVDLGFQLDLAFFKFFASGSAGRYPSVSGGIGFGF